MYDFSALTIQRKTLKRVLGFVFIGCIAVGWVSLILSYDSVALCVALVMVALLVFAPNTERQKAINAFAAKNKLTPMSDEAMRTGVPPCFEGVGYGATCGSGYVFSTGDGTCEIFEFSYETGSGKSHTTYQYTIATFRVDSVLPHLFLDGKQNGSSYRYSEQQRLGLEGDFDSYFSLYAPEGHQVDALTVLTPDLMQSLIESGRPFDIEILGNRVYVIADLSLYDDVRLPAALAFVSNLQKEFSDKAAEWRPLPEAGAMTLKKGSFGSDGLVIVVAIAMVAMMVLAIGFKHFVLHS